MTDIHALSQAKVVKKVRRAPDVNGGKQERQADRSDLNPIRFHISIYTADNKKKHQCYLSLSFFFFTSACTPPITIIHLFWAREKQDLPYLPYLDAWAR